MTANDTDAEVADPRTLDRAGLERRLEAVERALAEDEPVDRVDRLDDLEARVAELEAAVEAIRGYVGSVRAVNEEIERRAELALRTARAVRRHVDAAPGGRDGADGQPSERERTDASPTDAATVEPIGGDDHAVSEGDTGADSVAGGATLARLRERL